MDHSLKSIAFIADLGELLIVMSRVRLLQPAESGGETASGSGSGSGGACACTCAAGGAAAGALTNGSAGGGSRRSSNPSSRDDPRDDPHGLSQSLNAPRPPAGSACKCADHSLEPCPLHGQHVKVCTQYMAQSPELIDHTAVH